MMTTKEIKEILENTGFEYTGIRIVDEEYQIGETVENSRVWLYDEPTDEILDGASCIRISWRNSEEEIQNILDFSMETYFGDHIYLIGGDSAEFGEDPEELVIRDAEVLAIVK